MKYKDLEINKIYLITKGNYELRVGDHIWIGDDGSLNCVEACGWLEKDELNSEIINFTAVEDTDWELVVFENTIGKSYFPRMIKHEEACIA